MNNANVFLENINRYMKERKSLDLNAVYVRLKDKYHLILTNTFSLENGAEDYDEDFMILCGESAIGRFQLYDDGLDIVFDVDKADGSYLHWHPENFEEAVNDVELFMQGCCRN